MGKRRGGGQENKSKRIKAFTTLEPGWKGIFVTCARKKEVNARAELVPLVEEYVEKIAPEGDSEQEGDIEDMIAAEVAQMSGKKQVEGHLIGCECVIFIRIKGPADPVQIVREMCKDAAEGNQRTRYAQKLTPVNELVHASLENLTKFEPVVRAGFQQPGLKFAIRAIVRNSQMSKEETIKSVARLVGQEHKVDLKVYDRLVLVECFKSSIGLSVVDKSYDDYERFNLQQIVEKGLRDGEDEPRGDAKARAKEAQEEPKELKEPKEKPEKAKAQSDTEDSTAN